MESVEESLFELLFKRRTDNKKDRIPDYTLDTALTIREELTVYPELCEIVEETPGRKAGRTPSSPEYELWKGRGSCIGTSIIAYQGLIRSLVSNLDLERTYCITQSLISGSVSRYNLHSRQTSLKDEDMESLEHMTKEIFTRLKGSSNFKSRLYKDLVDSCKVPFIKNHIELEGALNILVNFSNHLTTFPNKQYTDLSMHHYKIAIGQDELYPIALFNITVPASSLTTYQLSSLILLNRTYHSALERIKSFTRSSRLKNIPSPVDCWETPMLTEDQISVAVDATDHKLDKTHEMCDELNVGEADTFLNQSKSKQNALTNPELTNISYGKIRFTMRASKNILISEVYHDQSLLYRHVGSLLHLLCLKDVIAQRRIALTLATVRDNFLDYRIPDPSRILKLYELGDIALALLGNTGFKLVKMFETQAIAYLHKRSEEKLDFVYRSEFFDSMKLEFDQVAKDLHLVSIGANVHKLFETFSEEEILEVAGLFRQWGHPIIFVSLGLTKVHQNATLDLPHNKDLMEELAADLKHLLLRHYFRQNGRWPLDTKYEGSNNVLTKAIKNGVFPSVSMGENIGVEWLKVTFDRCVDRNSVIPILELISDKSHAISRDELRSLLNSNNLLMKTASRRVLDTLLQYSAVDIDALLSEIDENGIPLNDLIIMLNEKEREMKLEGRLFALMSFRLRCYFVATEWLISKYILPVLPEISVNKTQTELQKCLYNLTGVNQGEKEFNQHFIHLDYEKWNNFQRKESTEIVFKIMDEALGYHNLISRTHDIFSNCFIGYSKRLDKIPADLSEKLPWCWYGHKGGLEGLRQKGWSVVGALLLRKVGRMVGRKIQILLQGDNQLVVLKYDCMYSKEESEYIQERMRIREMSDEVLTKICTLSDSIGLHIKPEETWLSNNILYYGKYPVLYGTARGMVLKRLCRMFSMANELTPSLANLMNACVTTCLSAGVQKVCSWELPILCWWYQCRIIDQYLSYDPLCGQPGWEVLYQYLKGTTNKQWDPMMDRNQYQLLLRILLTEPSMGGLGGTLPLRFAIRAFPDPVTESLTCCKLMYDSESCSANLKIVLIKIGNPPIGRYSNYLSLLEDPTSLNISKTTKPTNVIRDAVLSLLKSNKDKLVKNNDLYRALDVLNTDEGAFVEEIMKIQPCFVKLLSNIYSASIFGVAHSVVAKFAGTRTLVTLALNTASINVRSELFDCENKLYKSMAVLHLYSGNEVWDCSSHRAQDIRTRGWKKEIVGITTPHPAEQFREYKARWCEICECQLPNSDLRKGYMLVLPDDTLTGSTQLLHRGPFDPYLGGKTAEKRIGLTALEGDTRMTPVERVSKLLKDSGWAYKKGSNLHKMMLQLLNSFTEFDIENLLAAYTIMSGEMEHRYATPRISSGSFCSNNFTGPTRVNCSSNKMGILGKGRDNYVIVYQSLFLYAASVQYHRMQLNGNTYASHWHPNCVTCLIPCTDIICDLAEPPRLALMKLGDLNTPMTPSYPLPESGNHLGRYTFLSETAVKVRMPTWINLPLVQLNEPIDNLRRSLVLIIATTTLGSSVAQEVAGLDMSKSLSLSQINVVDTIELIRIQSHVLISMVLCNSLVERESRSSGTLNLSSMLSELTAAETMSIKEQVVRLATKAGTDLLIRTIGTSEEAVRNIIRYHPGPLVGPYPISYQILLNCYRSILKDYAVKFSLSSHIESVVPYLDRIVLPADYLSPPYMMYLAALQRLIVYNEDVRFVVSWKRSLSDRLDQSWDTQEIQQYHRDLLSLKLDTSLWRINIDSKSLSKLLPDIRRDIVNLTLHPLTLPISRLAYKLVIKELNQEYSCLYKGQQKRSPIAHMVRPIVFGANGTRKILSILESSVQLDPKVIVLAGDGNGGFSRACLSKYPRSKILFTSLAQFGGSLEQAGNIQIPMCLLGLTKEEIASRVISPNSVLTEVTDMTKPGWVSGVLSRIKDLSVDMIISDAEIRNQKHIQKMCNNLLTLIEMTEPTEVFLKFHLSYDQSYHLRKIVSLVMPPQSCYCVAILRSPYSNFGSFEIYLHLYKKEYTQNNSNLEAFTTSDVNLLPDDQTIISLNQAKFLLSDKAQLNEVRKETFGFTSLTQRKMWVQRGLWEREKLANELGIQLTSKISPSNLNEAIVSLREFLDQVASSSITLATFRGGRDARMTGRLLPRKVAVALIGITVAAGVFTTVLAGDLVLYKRALRWYRLENIGIRCSVKKNIGFDLGQSCKNIGMDIPFREFKPICHAAIRYLTAVIRDVVEGSFNKINTALISELLEHPLVKLCIKNNVDFCEEYHHREELAFAEVGGVIDAHHIFLDE